MNGKLNMRRIIKDQTESNDYSIDELIVSDETINSGNYEDANKILQKEVTEIRDSVFSGRKHSTTAH